MDPKEQLRRLVRLQELARTAAASRAVVEGAPGRIEEIEARFRERNAEYVALQDRHDELESDRRARSTELDALEDSRKKYMDDLMQVQNQREYAAMLKEIDGVKARIADHEDAILKAMEEVESLKGDLETHAAHIKEERARVDSERAQVESSVAEAQQTIASSEAERAQIESEMPGALVLTVRRLEHGRQGLFLAQAKDGTCQACYVRVRPQVYQEVRLGTRVHCCSSCRRFLYHEAAVKAVSETAEGTTG